MWNEVLIKFPKTQRYTLGEMVSKHLLDILGLLLSAASSAKTTDKLPHLKQASAKIDLTKLLVRLSKDCKCITNVQYLKTESRLVEAGKMLGGWIKHAG
ncbi:four helix bundle protein [Candidatus Uhrbacteria bacterium]|nr:four helix bundle protein [Candidatus Uhrbacteria bacterium]